MISLYRDLPCFFSLSPAPEPSLDLCSLLPLFHRQAPKQYPCNSVHVELMGSGNMNGGSTSEKKGETSSSSTKCCSDCKTTKTPLWRLGPSGPKSLCNACGIRYRKKRVSVGSAPPAPFSPERKRERPPAEPHGPHHEGSDMGKGISESVRLSLFLVGNNLLIRGGKKQRCRRKRKLGEEELAAVSLMALSCGCVFA